METFSKTTKNTMAYHGVPTLLPAETRSRRSPAGSPTAAPLRTFRQGAWPASDALASPAGRPWPPTQSDPRSPPADAMAVVTEKEARQGFGAFLEH